MSDNSVLIIASYAKSLIKFRGDLINALVKKGHSVHVCAPELVSESETVNELVSRGATIHEVSMNRSGLNPIVDVKTFFQLLRVISSVKPVFVIAYTIKPVIYGMLSSALCKVKVPVALITGLGYAFTENKGIKRSSVQWLLKVLYRLALYNAKVVIFQNKDDCALFCKLALVEPKKAGVVNGSGVNLREYSYTPVKDTKCIKFLLIARLLKDKGILEYVAAARVLRAKYTNVEFGLVGWIDSNPASIARAALDEWVHDDIVKYYGHLEDVRPALINSCVYVLPSYREGTPRTVLEAMSIGRPIITTDVPGCRETVINGKNGYLVPAKSSDALANAMERFVLHPELIPVMSLESRKFAEEKYDVARVNEEMFKLINLSSYEKNI